MTPVSAVVGKKVHTIEGLPDLWPGAKAPGPDGAPPLHPIQQAWIDVQVPQCGYCQSGMMIAAADLLQRIPRPTVAQIKEAFSSATPSPHLCRCGTYAAIIEAVQLAGRSMETPS